MSLIVYGLPGNSDVFGKIKGLIADMISKLEAEAEQDAARDIKHITIYILLSSNTYITYLL